MSPVAPVMSNSAPNFTVCCCAAAPDGQANSDPAAAATVVSMSLRFIAPLLSNGFSNARRLVRVRPVFEVRARHPPPIGQSLRLEDQEDDDHDPKDDLTEGIQDREDVRE